MVARITDAVNAYSNAATRGLAPGMDARATPGESFADLVRDMVTDAVDTAKVSEQVSADALTGKADVTEVVMAVNNAELSLQAVVGIRDKVIEAYQEIIRMPI